ncbi:phosphoenolpyruvate carboxylase [Thalassotalea litorea]|uniref:phosphoenolpyruvate carboxylase n=1 Tax=Thalassotalea litorea TaxID=2020715 RepID=UPI0037368195
MSQPILESGQKLLNALANHSDVVMHAFVNGRISEESHNEQVLKSLQKLGILWRPEPGEELRLRSHIRSLLEHSLRDESSRQLETNIQARLQTIKTVVSHYHEAMNDQGYAQAEVYLEDLTEQVYGLSDSLKSGVRNLWRRIHNEFGYVSSINAKIRENELAQKQVTQMREQLQLLQFDELTKLAGTSRPLRRLMVVHLQNCHSETSKELSSAQARLIELLGQFRQYLQSSQLLKGFIRHCRQKPQYQPKDPGMQNAVNPLFNRAAAIIKPAAISVNNIEHETDLSTLVAGLKRINRKLDASDDKRQGQDVAIGDVEEISLIDDELHQAVEQYFCEVIDNASQVSAMQFLSDQSLNFDAEEWIYAVINGYQGLGFEEQEFFEMDTLGHQHPMFNNNFVIEDVRLGLR